jgi:hypothetical protein
MMIYNVKTLQCVHHTHAKFIALTVSSALLEDREQGLKSMAPAELVGQQLGQAQSELDLIVLG